MKSIERIAGPDWKDGFLFVGNELALDFLNTRPVQNGEATELLPDFAALVGWFRAAGILTEHRADELTQKWAESSAGKLTVDDMRRWRERLRKQVIAWEKGASLHPAMVKEVNQLMAEHPMRFRLSSQKKPSTELCTPCVLLLIKCFQSIAGAEEAGAFGPAIPERGGEPVARVVEQAACLRLQLRHDGYQRGIGVVPDLVALAAGIVPGVFGRTGVGAGAR